MKKSILAVLAVVVSLYGPAWAGESAPRGRAAATSALDRALDRADLAATTQALKAGANPNATMGGETALAKAVMSNNPAIVELVLKAGANPNLCPTGTSCPFRALHVVYSPPRANEETNRDAIAELLLRAGANPNGSPKDDMHPLHRAVEYGSTHIAILLIEAGADVQGRAPGGAPLQAALRRGDHAMASRLAAARAKLDPSPDLLEAIARNGDAQGLDMAIGLMRQSAKGDKLDLSAALVAATWKDCAECVRLLLVAGTPHALQDRYSDHVTTTWFDVMGSAGADVLKVYAAHGLDPLAANADKTTLLHLAARSGKVDSVKWLVSRGVPIDAQEERTLHTPLMAAAERGHTQAVNALLDAGANSALLDTWGKTPKVLAAQASPRTAGHDEVVRLLHDRCAIEYTGTKLPASTFDAEVAGKAQEDVTGGFYAQLPFLRPGLRFFGAYVRLRPLNRTPDSRPGPEATMYAVMPDLKVIKLARRDDLISLGIHLRSEDDALRLVRFYADPGYAHQSWLRAKFDSMGFWEMPEDSSCFMRAGWKGAREPVVVRETTAGGTRYVVSRYMIPNSRLAAVGLGMTVPVDEIVQTIETVDLDGAYLLKTKVLATPALVLHYLCGVR
jgi:ankyrin repeat protein